MTLYMSNQYVCFTGYITLKPDEIGLCSTTARKCDKRDAKSKVGPLPTDWPYKMMFSSEAPYVSIRHV
jgi:hypothetical protein